MTITRSPHHKASLWRELRGFCDGGKGERKRATTFKVKDSQSPNTYAFEITCEVHEPGAEGYVRMATLFNHTEAYLTAEEADTLGQVLQHAAKELRSSGGRRRKAAA